MPSSKQHNQQVIHNKKLLSEDIFNSKSSNYPDWIITICYYCAVHLIDSKLADMGFEDVGIHDDRKRLIRQQLAPIFKGIYKFYMEIENKSRKARYHCLPINSHEVNFALESMEKIEKLLA